MLLLPPVINFLHFLDAGADTDPGLMLIKVVDLIAVERLKQHKMKIIIAYLISKGVCSFKMVTTYNCSDFM